MGRKVKESAFAEEGAAVKLPSNKDYKILFDKLDKYHEVRANNNADIKGVFDEASNKGIDRAAMKIAYKEYKSRVPEETKIEVNRILSAMGQLDLFHVSEGHNESPAGEDEEAA